MMTRADAAVVGSAAAKERIVAAAGPIFADRGYAGATVRLICSAAETNVASVKYHFGNKAGLYLACFELACQMREADIPLQPMLAAPAAASGSAAGRVDRPSARLQLQRLVRTLLGRIAGERSGDWHSRLLWRELLEPTQVLRDPMRAYVLGPHRALLGLVDALAMELGAPPPPLRVAYALIAGCLFPRVGRPLLTVVEPEQVDQLLELDAWGEQLVDGLVANLMALRDADRHRRPVGAAEVGEMQS
jgi:TetR/AcrR family transcriptional regulator, regulator of cefoperazone and chloramphenicol sensitivity